MPDDNKFEKLREVGYRIPGLCGYCKHGEFNLKGDGWGTCGLHRYVHLKHDNPEGGRGVSVHVTGTCPSFDVAHWRPCLTGLGAHMEFFNAEAGETDSA